MMKQLQSAVLMGFMLSGGLTMPSFAYDISDWYRQQTQGFQEFEGKRDREFQEFKDERDRQFTAFLKEHWRKMRLLEGMVRDETPKPDVIPKVKPIDRPKPSPELPPVRPPAPVVVPPPPPPAPVIPADGTRIEATFYGHQLPFRIDSAFKASVGYTINKQTISDYWATLSRADYEPLLEQLNAQRQALRLNDWAYLLLVRQLVKEMQPNRYNEQVLITWFLLAKDGYRARIAYDNKQIYLFMPTKQPLYAVSYFTFDGLRYYVIPFDGGSQQQLGQVSTYDNHYPGADKDIDMQISTAIVTKPKDGEKQLTFRYGEDRYQITAKYDQHTVAFLNTYPQLDIEMYFISTVRPETGKQLLEQLKPLVTGQSELEAVNRLLRFVQTAFKYQTDKEQFNEENYLFPEETLFYPYSDCEDRSILFAWLVRNLLKLEVVGLDYPGHIATAVHFNGDVNGDGFIYRGEHYVITDPTYINANAGMAMPQFKNTKPGVIPIR
jgi:hypothetical protein